MANTKKYVSLEKLGLYDEKIKKVITDADAVALQSAKDYADSLATNYDAAGSAATAKSEAIEAAKTETTTQVNALANGQVKTNTEAISGLQETVKNIQENAYDDTEVRGLISGLDTNKADKTQVATDIAAAVKAEEDARKEAVQGVQGAVDTLSGTHATDKKALEDAIALKADITALNEVSAVANAAVKQADYDVKVKALEDEDARIAGLVSEEAAKAREEEGKLDARLVEVETFFKTAEGETIDQAMDTLVEIQKYITEDGAAADQMVKDIAANKKSIEDHVATDHDFAGADAALKSELEGKINAKADTTVVEGIDGRLEVAEGKITTVEGKVSTLEGEMDAVEAAVATKAEAQALTDAVAALEGADAGLAGRIEALEAKHGDGEGTVESLIATAKQEAINAASQDATTKANGAKDAAIAKANELNTAMNTRVEALEAIDHEHANKAELDKVADGDVAKWNAAEQNAKTFAQGLNDSMNTRVEALETWHNNYQECSEQDILDMFA